MSGSIHGRRGVAQRKGSGISFRQVSMGDRPQNNPERGVASLDIRRGDAARRSPCRAQGLGDGRSETSWHKKRKKLDPEKRHRRKRAREQLRTAITGGRRTKSAPREGETDLGTRPDRETKKGGLRMGYRMIGV